MSSWTLDRRAKALADWRRRLHIQTQQIARPDYIILRGAHLVEGPAAEALEVGGPAAVT
jgi:hypothetical protein